MALLTLSVLGSEISKKGKLTVRRHDATLVWLHLVPLHSVPRAWICDIQLVHAVCSVRSDISRPFAPIRLACRLTRLWFCRTL